MATSATGTSKSLSVINSWAVEKYARLVNEPGKSAFVPQSNKAGSWKLFSSNPSGEIKLALLETNHLMVYSGAVIYESFSLWNAKKWIKGITKGDSILFVHKINEESRRFRIKLAANDSVSSVEVCRQCLSVLSNFITFREIGSQSGVHDNSFMDSQSLLDYSQAQQQPISPVSSAVTMDTAALHIETSSVAKTLLQQPCGGLGRAYADTNFPTSQIGAFIRLCLSDPNFPGFVEKVDTELNKIVT